MKIFLGGETSRREFRAVERDVRLAAARIDAEIWARESLSFDETDYAALVELSRVDFFLLCRSTPNEFTPSDVEFLRRRAPLSPIALVAGAFCEGENRTGAVFPGARRFYVADWRVRGRFEFFRFLRESTGAFAAPPVATNVDLALAESKVSPVLPVAFASFDVAAALSNWNPAPVSRASISPNLSSLPNRPSLPSLSSESFVAIFADVDPALGRFLRDAFLRRGVEARVCSILRPIPRFAVPPTRIVVDSLDPSSRETASTLRKLRETFPTIPIDLLAFSPRVDEIDFWENAAVWGPVRVVGKPFDVDFLSNAPNAVDV